jgi:hypothetical protein
MRVAFIELISKEASVTWGLVIGAICLLGQWVMVGLFIWQLPPEIPLWYSLPAGSQQLTDRQWLLIIPGISLGIFGLNLLILRFGISSIKVLFSILVWLTTLGLFMATVAMIHILVLAI